MDQREYIWCYGRPHRAACPGTAATLMKMERERVMFEQLQRVGRRRGCFPFVVAFLFACLGFLCWLFCR